MEMEWYALNKIEFIPDKWIQIRSTLQVNLVFTSMFYTYSDSR